MGLSRKERRYLRAFVHEIHKPHSRGWLTVDAAAERSGVESEGGLLAQRLAAIGLLDKKQAGHPEYRVTGEGENVARRWWKRNIHLLVVIVIAVVGWLLWVLERFVIRE